MSLVIKENTLFFRDYDCKLYNVNHLNGLVCSVFGREIGYIKNNRLYCLDIIKNTTCRLCKFEEEIKYMYITPAEYVMVSVNNNIYSYSIYDDKLKKWRYLAEENFRVFSNYSYRILNGKSLYPYKNKSGITIDGYLCIDTSKGVYTIQIDTIDDFKFQDDALYVKLNDYIVFKVILEETNDIIVLQRNKNQVLIQHNESNYLIYVNGITKIENDLSLYDSTSNRQIKSARKV
jgi:hypothetical protein